MSIIGKLHEISFYGVITTIINLILGHLTINELIQSSIRVNDFTSFFKCTLFWTSALYLVIAIIGAILTKYNDDGEGLTFTSDNVIVIIFAHIGEEILGIFLTPIWFLKDIILGDLKASKIVDYILYFIEVFYYVYGSFMII